MPLGIQELQRQHKSSLNTLHPPLPNVKHTQLSKSTQPFSLSPPSPGQNRSRPATTFWWHYDYCCGQGTFYILGMSHSPPPAPAPNCIQDVSPPMPQRTQAAACLKPSASLVPPLSKSSRSCVPRANGTVTQLHQRPTCHSSP